MKPTSNLFAAVAILLASFPVAAQSQAATSVAELRLGIYSYKNGQYEDATRHFAKAIELDGSNINARLYLATTYMSQYIPGVDSPDNIHFAEAAIEQYQHVLGVDAELTPRVNSAKGIGYLYLNMKKFDDSKKYYRVATDLDPDDPEPHYSIGVIDWTKCYQPRMDARALLGLRPEDHLDPNDPEQNKVCGEFKVKNTPAIEEGIDSLSKAIQLRPDYDDAMAYLNLMYREKADVECDDLAARAEDLRTADHWVDMTLRVKKLKAEKNKREAVPTAPSPQ
jgi:tetratricopeptide (TPR) repeat protein